MELDRAAAQITRDLKEVVFVGAYAAMAHGLSRGTHDLDLALASPLTDEEFVKLGYGVFREGGMKVIRTREGVKLDVYTRDVSGIAVPRIFATAVTVRAAGSRVRVMCLEALLLAKMRAGRPQDAEDIRQLCRLRGKAIRWGVVESMAEGLELAELKGYVRAFS